MDMYMDMDMFSGHCVDEQSLVIIALKTGIFMLSDLRSRKEINKRKKRNNYKNGRKLNMQVTTVTPPVRNFKLSLVLIVVFIKTYVSLNNNRLHNTIVPRDQSY